MVYTWKELVKKNGSRFAVEARIAKGEYKKVAHGLYTDDGGYLSELEQLFMRYPKATLTMQRAFEY